MQVKIKRFDKSLPLPSYKTNGAVCVDLCARLDCVIKPHEVVYIPLNVAVEIPNGYWGMLVSRSSTHKMGLIQVNGIGVFDLDYKGDNDEYIFPAYNYTDSSVEISKGTRLAQLMIMKFEPMEFIEVNHMDSVDRGGFGTSGQK